MKTHLTSLAGRVLFACAIVTGCDEVGDDSRILTSGTVSVLNQSNSTIVELYIAEAEDSFGPNLLEDEVIRPDQDLLINLQCDVYNVRMIDDAGLACELLDVNTCFDDTAFVHTNGACEVRTAPTDD
jgi:hypothetical protein